MQMMYDIVGSELKSSEQPDLHPLDYLNFYCLGKREERPENGLTTDDATVTSQKGICVYKSSWLDVEFFLFLPIAICDNWCRSRFITCRDCKFDHEIHELLSNFNFKNPFRSWNMIHFL